MPITQMVSMETATAAFNSGKGVVTMHDTFCGLNATDICHAYKCPHQSKPNALTIPMDDKCITGQGVSGCHPRGPIPTLTTHHGAVLALTERNMRDDSDFLALVYDEATNTIKSVMYATTRGWTYGNSATVDATEEIKAKVRLIEARAYIQNVFAKYQEETLTPRIGKKLVVTSGRHKNVSGLCNWEERSKFGKSMCVRLDFADRPLDSIFVSRKITRVCSPVKSLKECVVRWGSHLYNRTYYGGTLTEEELATVILPMQEEIRQVMDTEVYWNAAFERVVATL